MDENKNHSLCLEEQKRLTVNGVISVDAFSDQVITATVQSGKLLISGESLRIISFSKSSGLLNADGKIYGIKYSKPKVPFIKRLTK